MNSRNNTNLHFEVTSNGQFVSLETSRDSFGGWVNMLRRVEGRLGSELHSSDGGETWNTETGDTVRFNRVQTF